MIDKLTPSLNNRWAAKIWFIEVIAHITGILLYIVLCIKFIDTSLGGKGLTLSFFLH